MTSNKLEYITTKQAQELTGYKTTRLYQFRKAGAIKWTSAKSGQKIRYHKGDLLKIIGL